MRIDRVTYAKLVNLGNYENERIELSAQLDLAEDYQTSFMVLRDDVQRLGVSLAEQRGADREAKYQEYGAAARLERINADIKAAQVRWEKALELLAKHGIEHADLVADDDIPF